MEKYFGHKFFDSVVLQTYGIDKESSKTIIQKFKKSLAEFIKNYNELLVQEFEQVQKLKQEENLKYEESTSYFVKEFNSLWTEVQLAKSKFDSSVTLRCLQRVDQIQTEFYQQKRTLQQQLSEAIQTKLNPSTESRRKIFQLLD